MSEKEEAKVWISGEDILKKFDEFDTFYEEHSEEIDTLCAQVTKLRLDIWELSRPNYYRDLYYYSGRESRIDRVMDTMITFRKLFHQSVDGRVFVSKSHLDAIDCVDKSVVTYHIRGLNSTIKYLTEELEKMKSEEVIPTETVTVIHKEPESDDSGPPAMVVGIVLGIIVVILIAVFSN